jgi:type I restriction enzyme R subunit
MSNLSELNSVEKPVTEWLTKMGWRHQSKDELKVYSRPFSNPIIEPILKEKIKIFNDIDDASAQTVLEQLTQHLNHPDPILGNEKFHDKLVKGVTVTINGKDRDFYFIDFNNIWDNDFMVTNQYWVQGAEMVKTDIVLLINGIPIVPIEAKQRAKKGVNWMQGVKQFNTYSKRADKLFICHGYGVACNGRITKYGIPGASASYFSEWKDTIIDTHFDNPILDPSNDLCKAELKDDGYYRHNIPEYEQMKRGIVGLLQPARVLDILQHFIVFERTLESGIVKKVARYQQLRASNKIVDRVVDQDKKSGVIWHTQGSGKSLTMLYTSYKLRQHPKLNDPTVYIVVDRKDLKEQMGGTFDDCEFPNTSVPATIPILKSKITGKPAEVIITTIQKFQDLGDVKDERENVIVLIDEAHRTQYGEYQIELRSVLPNARQFAFTGTPIDKTIRDFGIREGRNIKEYYLDRYDIEDSIKDGATKPVRYTFGPQQWFLDKEKLKLGWQEITADLNEEERALVQRRTQSWKTFLKHSERREAIAKDIAEDFRNVVEPQGYKVQIVACDKEACVLYYNELRKYFDASEMSIVFSKSHYDDEERYNLYKDHYLEDGERKRLINQFKKRITEEEIKKGNNLKILIVCNMLLTGFDAPVEQTMYLDSPLRDHNLLQAIARTNRPYDDPVTGLSKEFGRIVDYIGVFKNYNEALNYDPEDITEFEDVDSLVIEFPKFLDIALEPFKEIKLEDTYECTIAIVRVLSKVDQAIFESNYRDVVQLFEATAPHPNLREHLSRYKWLIAIYEIYLEEFKRLDFDPEIYAAKTRKLIEESSSVNLKNHLPAIQIDEKYLDNLKSSKLSASDKAEKIIRDIETVIRRNEIDNPVYVEFQERLDALIKEKESETKTIADLLKDLEELFGEVEQVATLPQKMGFDDRGSFDIYIEIKNGRDDKIDLEIAKDFAKKLSQSIKNKIYIGWQESDAEVKRFEVDLKIFADFDEYESLNISDDKELVDRIVKRIIQHYSIV